MIMNDATKEAVELLQELGYSISPMHNVFDSTITVLSELAVHIDNLTPVAPDGYAEHIDELLEELDTAYETIEDLREQIVALKAMGGLT